MSTPRRIGDNFIPLGYVPNRSSTLGTANAGNITDNPNQRALHNGNMPPNNIIFDTSIGRFRHRNSIPDLLWIDASAGPVEFGSREHVDNTSGNTPADSSSLASEDLETSSDSSEGGNDADNVDGGPLAPVDPEGINTYDADIDETDTDETDTDETDINVTDIDETHIDERDDDESDIDGVGTANADTANVGIAKVNAKVNIADIDIAALAPYAPKNRGTYTESIGEILTQESWRKILAGIPAGKELKEEQPLCKDEPPSPIPEPMFEEALSPEDGNFATLSQPHSRVDGSIYGGTPPPVVVEDPGDSEYHYGQAEAESDGDSFPDHHDEDDEDDDDDLSDDIPLPKDDSEDEDYVLPSQKHALGRKASISVKADAPKQVKKSGGGNKRSSHSFKPPTPQAALIPKPSLPMASVHSGQDEWEEPDGGVAMKNTTQFQQAVWDSDDNDDENLPKPGNKRQKLKQTAKPVTTAFQTPTQAGPSTARINHAPMSAAWAEEAIPAQDRPKNAMQLQMLIASLREEVKQAEIKYDEAANNPIVARDPRTKKRRLDKLEEMYERLDQAVEEQAQLRERYGAVPVAGQGIPRMMTPAAFTAPATFPSFSTGPPAIRMPTRLQLLEQEVTNWCEEIQDLRYKAMHCQAQLDDVDANPQKYTNRRVGFRQGRVTRLLNAQHSLSYGMQKLREQEWLYTQEYQRVRVHGAVFAQRWGGQIGQQQVPVLVPVQYMNHVQTAANHHMQLHGQWSGSPASSHKRKASELEEEDSQIPLAGGSGFTPTPASAFYQ